MKSQLQDLYRRTGLTKESCFYASRRIGKHDTLSLWSLTTLAFCLIIVSLITQVYSDNGFVIEFERFIDISITSMSVFALVISVLIQKSDFSLRSEKYRNQAMEISGLRISFRHLIDNEPSNGVTHEELYTNKSQKYDDILNRNLVHEQIDYLITNSKGIELKYYKTKLFITEYLGYWAIIIITISLLSWVCVGTYSAS
ncbi:SLATT domain-containing protein [Pseudoalteromonas shioyasakiensis]|uniref:SLATT domain-containing protein n=1 Tax=Pseudoalteromonas shioyasakiensis TaxID=1190813 RepID=UPI0021190082|nr:SLATT domain-containing protein [Pseudoalteromonas shioyasakiensis]MCQ8881402.1 SLATT domain-containing protein [Pseudoalteromonas shioyasakiensis]